MPASILASIPASVPVPVPMAEQSVGGPGSVRAHGRERDDKGEGKLPVLPASAAGLKNSFGWPLSAFIAGADGLRASSCRRVLVGFESRRYAEVQPFRGPMAHRIRSFFPPAGLAPAGRASTTVVVTIAAALFAVWPLRADAGLSVASGRKVARTRIYASDPTFSRIWLADTAGNLWSRADNTVVKPWHYWGTQDGVPISSGGVTAVAYSLSGIRYEHVLYVGTGGARIYTATFRDGVFASWESFAAPAGVTLTGEIEAFTRLTPARTIHVLVTATDGVARRYVRAGGDPPSWSGPAVANTAPCGPVSAGPIASAVRPDEGRAWWFLRSSSATNLVYAIDYNGGTFSCGSLGSPGIPGGMASSLAADAGVWGTTGSVVRLFATPLNPTQRDLWTRSLINTGNWSGWTIVSGNPNPLVSHRANALATTHRSTGGANDLFDTFALNSTGGLIRDSWQGVNLGWTTHGRPAEVDDFWGGMVARPGDDHAVAYLVGNLTSAYYLVSYSTDTGSTVGPWYVHGSGARSTEMFAGGSGDAETFVANWKGRILAAATVRSDTSTPPHIETAWSSTDGLTFDPAVTMPTPTYADTPLNYYDLVSDPTTAFDPSGVGYVTAIAAEFPSEADVCNGLVDPIATYIFYMTTSDGSYLGSDVFIASGLKLDHPWMAIDRVTGKLHFTWWDTLYDNIRYCSVTPGGANTCTTGGEVLPVPMKGAPILILDAAGLPYVAALNQELNDVVLCSRVEEIGGSACCRPVPADPTTCAAPNVPVNLDVEVGPIKYDEIPVGCAGAGCTGEELRNFEGFSLIASPATPGRLYYAYMKAESPLSTHFDIAMSASSSNGAAGSWSLPTTPGYAPNDGDDQFNPALAIAALGSFDSVIVTWYDRSLDYNGCSNHYIWPKYSVSLNSGGSWYTADLLRTPQDVTNPCLLPRNCRDDLLFIGDFHEGVGERYHTHLSATEAPDLSPLYTARPWETFFGTFDFDD